MQATLRKPDVYVGPVLDGPLVNQFLAWTSTRRRIARAKMIHYGDGARGMEWERDLWYRWDDLRRGWLIED